LSNSNRDSQGRWSSANIAAHTPSNAANAGGGTVSAGDTPAQRGPGVSIASLPSADNPGSGGMSPAASIAHDDDWSGTLGAQTSKLLNRPGGAGVKSGMGSGRAQAPQPRNYAAGFTALGLRAAGYGQNEQAGQHQVDTPEGQAQHGRDVPGSGVPGPADPADPGGVPGAGPRDWSPAGATGGAEAAGAASGAAELAPLALAL
jgi:hypothetical protein